ncbi:hypothetical protein GOB57_08245 [Sinorhizobium meliloti]|nr:hypothetical protein [Sinorhizobium meliloti]
MSRLTKHAAFIDAVEKARNAAALTLEAATALIDARLSAIRQCVDIDDTAIVVETEALAARASAWRSEVSDAARIVDEALELASERRGPTNAADCQDKQMKIWLPYLAELEAKVASVECDGGDALAQTMIAGFDNDPVFSHLAHRRHGNRFSFGDRMISKWIGFGEALARYERNVAYVGERQHWLDDARQAIGDAKRHIEDSTREYNDTVTELRARTDDAAAAVGRAWNALMLLLGDGAQEFAQLDLDAACCVAREAAAASVRGDYEVLPFSAEQDNWLAALASRRAELKLYDEKITATV